MFQYTSNIHGFDSKRYVTKHNFYVWSTNYKKEKIFLSQQKTYLLSFCLFNIPDEFLANDQITKNSLVPWSGQIYQNSTGLLLQCTCINKNDRQFMAL